MAVKGDKKETEPSEDESSVNRQRKRKPSHDQGDTEQLSPPCKKILKLEETDNSSEKQDKGVSNKKIHCAEDTDDTEPPEKVHKLDVLDPEEESKIKGKKYVRKRLKFLLQAVLDQMEFYFCDSNLSKDRFLKKYIDQSPDGYVDLSIFGNFNKLQQLRKEGVSLKILAKALEQSKVLQLNGDKTKVKRTTPFKEISSEETGNRTVYVEYLPTHATHAWIQTTFAPCGKVVYISLPKYQSTGQIKGFAFVEFQSAEEAEKACKMLNNPPLTKEGEKPGKFPKGNKTLDRLHKLVPFDPNQTSNEENMAEEPKEEGDQRKKKKKGKKKPPTDESKQSDESQKPTESSVEKEGNKKRLADEKKESIENQVDGKDSKKKPSSDESKQPLDGQKSSDGADVKDGKKKKKKKKRRKQGLSQEESFVKDEDKQKKDGNGPGDEIPAITEPHEAPGKKKTIDVFKSENTEVNAKKKKKKKKKKKGTKTQDDPEHLQMDVKSTGANPKKEQRKPEEESESKIKSFEGDEMAVDMEKSSQLEQKNPTDGFSRKERKRLRQEDIRQKRQKRESQEMTSQDSQVFESLDASGNTTEECYGQRAEITQSGQSGVKSTAPSEKSDSGAEMDTARRKSDGSELTSILKSKPQKTQKKVEFNPVPVTQEFIREKEIRKRKKSKKDKLNLRVITKKEWQSLKVEYLKQQKSHMTALKESLRELRYQENQNVDPQPSGIKHIDLEDVFGTKRLKPSQDVKMAHVQALQFTPNVIVQWTSNNEMHRDKIRTMFKDISGDSIAYIDAQEEAKTGYIRFKDEASAEQFAKLSRHSNSFSARVLPVDQQQDYWDKANADRMKKLGRKKQEKGSQRIARKVFERNKVTFHKKLMQEKTSPNRIVFTEDTVEEKGNDE